VGRLVGIPYFSSDTYWDDHLAYASQLRRAKNEKAKGFHEGEPCPIRELQIAHTKMLRSKFQNRVIRRTGSSVNDQGDQLMPLPQRADIILVVALPEQERRLVTVQSISEEDLERYALSTPFFAHQLTYCSPRAVQANTYERVGGHNFYTHPRLNNTFYREKLTDPIPKFRSREAWEKVESTKLRTVRLLVTHLLSSDNAPAAYTEDGILYLPALPELGPGELHPKTRKILIYGEFSSFHRLIVDVSSSPVLPCHLANRSR
jgi:hypothetical protein